MTESLQSTSPSHDTYVDGRAPRDLRAAARERPRALDRGGRRRPRVLERHALRRRPLREPHTPSSSRAAIGIRLEDMDAEETEARRTMMEMDAPEHTRLRRLVSRPFAPRSVADYEGAVRDLAARGPRRACDGRDEFDFVTRRRARAAHADARATARAARRGPRLAGAAAATPSSATPTPTSPTTSSTRSTRATTGCCPSAARSPSSSSSTPSRRSPSGAITRPHDVLTALLAAQRGRRHPRRPRRSRTSSR